MGKIHISVIRQPPSHPYYLRSSNKDREGKKEERNTKVLRDNFSRTYYLKRCQRKRLARIESLPDDLLFEILVRLPAEDIYDHARFVCWNWYRMIHTRKFLDAHFKHLDYGLLFFAYNGPSFFVAERQGRIEISKLNYKINAIVHRSCNGLFVESFEWKFSVRLPILCVTNYVTKQELILPVIPLRNHILIDSQMHVMAYSAISMEYKVVVVETSIWTGLDTSVFILTVGVDESWRTVDIGHLSLAARELFDFRPLITEGFMHWTDYGSEVLTLNIETETIMETPAPIPQDVLSKELIGIDNNVYYISTGRYLSLLVAHEELLWDVWEMKPETGEWRKVCNFALKWLFELTNDEYLEPFAWLKYPEVLVFRVNLPVRTFFFYNLLTQKIDPFEMLLAPRWLSSKSIAYHLVLHKDSLCWVDRC